MKRFRRTCAVTIVIAVLAVSAFAGQLDSPGVVSPPQPPTQPTSTSTSSTMTMILTILDLIRG